MGNRQPLAPAAEPLNPIDRSPSTTEGGTTSVPTHQMNSHLLTNSFDIQCTESSFSLTFKYDSLLDGSMSIYFFAAESLNAKGVTECYYIDTQRYPSPITSAFAPGLDQITEETIAYDLTKYSLQELTCADQKTFPLVIELRTSDSPNIIESTYVKFRLSGTNWQAELIKQKLTYGAEVFILNEIFGHTGNEEETRECVVCLTNPKETVVVPCDHMCLCNECANIMRSHYDSRCPMCRTAVQSLMHIIHS